MIIPVACLLLAMLDPAAMGVTERAQAVARAQAVIAEETAYVYGPYPHQDRFHKSQVRIRGQFAGNQSGKSYSAARDNVWLATGEHPYRQWWQPPVHIRVAADGYQDMVDNFLVPLYRKIVHPKYLIKRSFDESYSKGNHTLTFANGSTIQFMSYKLADLGKGPQKFAAVQLHRFQFEEQGDKDTWDENMIRLLAFGGDVIVDYTPLLGTRSWYYDELYEPWQRGERTDFECFEASTDDNLSIPRASIEETYKHMDLQTVQIRRYGKFINIGGGVYPMWDDDFHVIPYDAERVRQASKTVIIDPHPSKATAVLWCGVSPDERLFAYREYREKKTIAEICDDIRRLSGENREDIRRYLIDPHWGWTVTEMGKSYQQQFIDNGIPVTEASKDKWGGIELMRGLLAISPSLKRANFEVMASCPRLIWEFKHYSFREMTKASSQADRWATVDVDDDLVTDARYYAQSNPRFVGQAVERKAQSSMTPTMQAMMKRREMV